MLAGFGKEQHHMGLGRFGDLNLVDWHLFWLPKYEADKHVSSVFKLHHFVFVACISGVSSNNHCQSQSRFGPKDCRLWMCLKWLYFVALSVYYIGCVSKLSPPNRWVSYFTNQLFLVRFKETSILTHSRMVLVHIGSSQFQARIFNEVFFRSALDARISVPSSCGLTDWCQPLLPSPHIRV